MTSEERMAYYMQQKKKTSVPQIKRENRGNESVYQKIKFMIAVFIFIIFLSLDYTETKIYGIGSQEIIEELSKDSTFLKQVASQF